MTFCIDPFQSSNGFDHPQSRSGNGADLAAVKYEPTETRLSTLSRLFACTTQRWRSGPGGAIPGRTGLRAGATPGGSPAARSLLHILMAAAEFGPELIRERSAAGLKGYRQEYQAGRIFRSVGQDGCSIAKAQSSSAHRASALAKSPPRSAWERERNEKGPPGPHRLYRTAPKPLSGNPMKSARSKEPVQRPTDAPESQAFSAPRQGTGEAEEAFEAADGRAGSQRIRRLIPRSDTQNGRDRSYNACSRAYSSLFGSCQPSTVRREY